MGGHTNLVGDLAFSPSGRLLATAGADGLILVWDMALKSVVRTIALPPNLTHDGSDPLTEALRFPSEDEVWSLSPFARFSVTTGRLLEYREEIAGRETSRDGRVLLGGWGRTLRAFSLSDGGVVGSASLDEHVCASRLMPDGKRVVVLTATDLEIRDLSDGGAPVPLGGGWEHGLDGRLALSRDGSLVAVERGPDKDNRTLEMRKTAGGAVVWSAPFRLLDLQFSPDGEILATSDDQGLIRLLSARDGTSRVEFRLFHEPWIRRIGFSPDGRVLAAGADDGVVRLFEVGSGTHLADLGRAANPVRRVEFAPSGSRLYFAMEDGQVACRAVGASGREWEFLESPGSPTGLAVVADGRLVLAGDGRRIHILDASTGKGVRAPVPVRPPFYAFAAAPDGRTFATGHAEGRVILHQTTEGTPVWEFRFPGQDPGAVLGLAFSGRGHLLALSGRETRVLDSATGETLIEIPGEWRDTQAAFSRDGRGAAVGDWLGGVELFRTFDWHRVGEVGPGRDGVSGLSLAPDGRWWASGTAYDNNAWLGRTKVRAHRLRLVGHTNAVVTTAFSPDGGLLATGSRDGTIRFWNATDGRPLDVWPGSGLT